jgi:hypothetical protein
MTEKNYEHVEHDHAEAMRHANDGFTHRYLGNEQDALEDFRKAWELERRAAMSLLDGDLEPSRSILFRSAASLALLCGEPEDARKLVHLGLSGQPSMRVREVLEAILADAEEQLSARVPSHIDLHGELHRFPGVVDFDAPPTSSWEQVA